MYMYCLKGVLIKPSSFSYFLIYFNNYISLSFCIFSIVCVSGSVQLLNSNTVTSNGYTVTTGLAAQCINGIYVTLCNDGTITQDTSDLFCNVMGYESKL